MTMPVHVERDGTSKDSTNSDRLADFTRDRRVLVLSGMALVVGVLGAFIAYALVWLIGLITNLSFYQRVSSAFTSPYGNHLGWLVIIVPVIGGIIIGLMARYGSDKIRGHGIPEALESILVGKSKMEPKVAVLKPLSSAISIGTGGPFGAEGPIIMTGGAFGSLYAQLFHMSPAERKTLLVAGAAAGMSAIFATPVAAVLLAVELLLFEWKPRSFIPVALASVVASLLRVPLLGAGPIFPVTPHAALSMSTVGWAFGVGILAGLGSALLTMLVYGFEDLFMLVPIHWMWWPAIGGVVVGVGGLIDPRVLGVGYDTIHDLLRGNVIGRAALWLMVLKAIVWAFSLGSGTSGGVLAPLLIMGGALGALSGQVLPTGDVSLWATIGMASMMSGTMRSPLTGMVFTLELTHDLNILPGLLAASIAAHAVTVLLMRRSILTEKVARHGHHIAREYTVDPLETLLVADVMDREPTTVNPSMSVVELAGRLTRLDLNFNRHKAYPVVDDQGRLQGIITQGDIVRAQNERADVSVLEACTRKLVIAYPDELVRDALNRMLKHHVGRLLVVNRNDPGKLLGYLGRVEVLASRLRRLSDEEAREQGWFARAS